eukprot:4996041-Pyramimonas_sp.AAC.1
MRARQPRQSGRGRRLRTLGQTKQGTTRGGPGTARGWIASSGNRAIPFAPGGLQPPKHWVLSQNGYGDTHWDLRWSSLWGHETCE